VHPNRFVFEPAEAGLFTQPKLSQLNRLLGRDESRKFVAVAFVELGAMTSKSEREGLAAELGTVIAHDAVLTALVSCDAWASQATRSSSARRAIAALRQRSRDSAMSAAEVVSY
jgi:hypothetical protein